MLSLVIGGSGSGKSAFAEALAQKLDGPKIYLATMAPDDGESLARIARHRRLREGKGFATLECPTALEAAALPPKANVLLEDLPNLLANELYRPEGRGAAAVLTELTGLEARCAHLTVVSGDLFSGGSDYAGETLEYLRRLAALHRQLAAKADLAVELVCGVPNILKGELP